MKFHFLLLLGLPLLVVACSGEDTTPPAQSAKIQKQTVNPASKQPAVVEKAQITTADPAARWYDFGQVSLGAKLFAANCAACHGQAAVGTPGWQRPGADGQYPAPPLNGTAHTWHHPLAMLLQKIKNGGQGSAMPAWGGILKDEEIRSIIAWFQSRWSDEIYIEWSRRDQSFRKQNGVQ